MTLDYFITEIKENIKSVKKEQEKKVQQNKYTYSKNKTGFLEMINILK